MNKGVTQTLITFTSTAIVVATFEARVDPRVGL